jgi:hypothetical protein
VRAFKKKKVDLDSVMAAPPLQHLQQEPLSRRAGGRRGGASGGCSGGEGPAGEGCGGRRGAAEGAELEIFTQEEEEEEEEDNETEEGGSRSAGEGSSSVGGGEEVELFARVLVYCQHASGAYVETHVPLPPQSVTTLPRPPAQRSRYSVHLLY